MEINLLKHQYSFIEDYKTKYLALVAGFGSGKTEAFIYKAIHLASVNIGYEGVLCEPTFSMIKDVLLPRLTDILQHMKIPYTYTASPYPDFILHWPNGDTKLLLRSAENFDRLRGLNLAFFGVDEADCIPKKRATDMCHVLQSRLRAGKVFQGFFVGTPEGFNFMYDFFEQSKGPDRRYIQASTYDNHFLPPEYINDLERNYPENLIQAYLKGHWVNLTTGNVYKSFDRALNHTPKTLADFPNHFLHIGVDFNINHTCGIVSVIDDAMRVYTVDEITNRYDTDDLIREILERYKNPQRIIIYPDASGKNRKTNAAKSDIALLKDAGFTLKFNNANPAVRDRVAAVNGKLCNGKGHRTAFVNIDKCPELTKTLEQQGYDDGEPDKKHGLDHVGDGYGYSIYYNFPIIPHGKVITH